MDFSSNSIKTVVEYYSRKISAIYPTEEAQAIVWILMEHFFKISRFESSLRPETRLSESELLIIHDACKKIVQHIPVQYVIEKTEFHGNSFYVNPSVLIPRPETEELLRVVLENLPDQPVCILDIGTGSGNIAVSLKKERPDCMVYACDISPGALDVARKNASDNHVEVSFFECDILFRNISYKIPEVDIIVSNPPYVCLSEKSTMRDNVLKHEPSQALFVKDNEPFIFYEAIAGVACNKLSLNGKIFFEINERFGKEVSVLLEKNHFGAISIIKDIYGKERFVSAVKN